MPIIKNHNADALIQDFIVGKNTRSIRLRVSTDKISTVREKLKKLEDGTLTEGVSKKPDEINLVTKKMLKENGSVLQEILTHDISEKEIYFLLKILIETQLIDIKDKDGYIHWFTVNFINLRALQMIDSFKNLINVLQDKKMDVFLPHLKSLVTILEKISHLHYKQSDIETLTQYRCKIKVRENDKEFFLDESLQKEFQRFGLDFFKTFSGMTHFSMGEAFGKFGLYREKTRSLLLEGYQSLQGLTLN